MTAAKRRALHRALVNKIVELSTYYLPVFHGDPGGPPSIRAQEAAKRRELRQLSNVELRAELSRLRAERAARGAS